jgi:AcrR family transcriptional regulator
VTPRRRLAPEARRQELLDAALTVLSERGVDARVEDVVRAAGAAKGTFYLYFPSWQDLLAAVREQVLAEFRAEVDARLSTATGDWWTTFLDELDRFVDFVVGMGPLHEALFHGPIEAPIPEGMNAPEMIADILRAGMEVGAVDTDVDPDATGMLIFQVTHGAGDAIKRGADRDRTVAALRRLVRHGVGAPRA